MHPSITQCASFTFCRLEDLRHWSGGMKIFWRLHSDFVIPAIIPIDLLKAFFVSWVLSLNPCAWMKITTADFTWQAYFCNCVVTESISGTKVLGIFLRSPRCPVPQKKVALFLLGARLPSFVQKWNLPVYLCICGKSASWLWYVPPMFTILLLFVAAYVSHPKDRDQCARCPTIWTLDSPKLDLFCRKETVVQHWLSDYFCIIFEKKKKKRDRSKFPWGGTHFCRCCCSCCVLQFQSVSECWLLCLFVTICTALKKKSAQEGKYKIQKWTLFSFWFLFSRSVSETTDFVRFCDLRNETPNFCKCQEEIYF